MSVDRGGEKRQASPFLNTRQAAHYLGLSLRNLERMRRRGEGPVFRRHSRFVYYHIGDLDAWSRSTIAQRSDHD